MNKRKAKAAMCDDHHNHGGLKLLTQDLEKQDNKLNKKRWKKFAKERYKKRKRGNILQSQPLRKWRQMTT